jgi:hypothetical protein
MLRAGKKAYFFTIYFKNITSCISKHTFLLRFGLLFILLYFKEKQKPIYENRSPTPGPR